MIKNERPTKKETTYSKDTWNETNAPGILAGDSILLVYNQKK